MSEHVCVQGPRFDAVEKSLTTAHDKLDQITAILVENARTDERLKTLEAFKDGAEPRIKATEDFIARNAWVIRMGERLVWIVIIAALALTKFSHGV